MNNNNNKITLKEFFANEKLLCIHCKTKIQALKLLQEFDKLGKKWCGGESYLTINFWDYYKDDTVYYNDGMYGSLGIAIKFDHKIYEFEDVIFE